MSRAAGLSDLTSRTGGERAGLLPVALMVSMLWLAPALARESASMNPSDRGGPLASGSVAAGPDGRVSLDALLDVLRADATKRLGGVRPADPQVQALNWPDGSLGCPQPGRLYTQALVRGYLVVFTERGAVLRYHASARGAWLLCPPGTATPPAAGPSTR